MRDFIKNPELTSPIFYWEFFVNQFETNQLFTGLLVLSLMGTIGYTLRGIPSKIWGVIVSQFTVQLKVQNEDDYFETLKLYLSQTEYVKNRCRRLTLTTNYDGEDTPKYRSRGICTSAEGRSKSHPSQLPKFTLTPMDGSHWFFYNHNIIFYNRSIDEEKGDERKETITLRYLGRSRNLIYKLIGELEEMKQDNKNTIKIYNGTDVYWNFMGEKLKRPLNTVYIPQKDKKFLMDDIQWFHDNAEWYAQRGIPYHRGYLFSGERGTGRTRIIKAIISGRLKMIKC